MTGLSIDTLRGWERRYAAVTPARDDRGRLYTDADIGRLRLLRGAVEHGHSIGRLAGLGDAELRRLVEAGDAAVPAPAAAPTTDTAGLTAALYRFDAVGIEQELARLAALLPPLPLLRDVLMPALVEVGEDWHQGRVGIARERLMSSAVRNLLGSFLRLHARRDVPAQLVFATPMGDRHEVGTLGAAMLAASSGLGVTYLGADLPAEAITASVTPAGAQVLVVGITKTQASASIAREMRTLLRTLPRTVELWVGGRGVGRYADLIGRRGLVFGDYDAYQRELVRIGGRVV
jgi:MerR family transcriptional regulator, light-induced transcriptional regulator